MVHSDGSVPTARKPRRHGWLTLLLVLGAVMTIIAAAAAVWYALQPVTLRIAVGPPGSDDQRLIQALAQGFARERSAVRLAPIQTKGANESIALLAAGQTDLAVGRGDLDLPADAQSVAILRKNVAVLWVPASPPKGANKGDKKPAGRVKTIADLAGRKIGVVGRTSANIKLLKVILAESGVAPDKVTIAQFGTAQLAEMARDPSLDAFMAVGPLDSKITIEAIAATVRARGEPTFLPIDVGDAIAKKFPLYESEEIPGSIFSAKPARPDDKVDTVAVNHLIMARKSLSEVTVANLTRQLFAARQSLAHEAPGVTKIEAPDTDKDAAVPAHRGAAAFIDGTERTFLERYSDYIWGVVLLLSGLGSVGAWLRGYLNRDETSSGTALRDRALELIGQARQAASVDDLDRMQREVDSILRDTLACFDDGAIDDLSAFGLVLEQFQQAVAERRATLQQGGASSPAEA
ncbi:MULTISPECIES: TAXI family TRAP transporter solute-binding subunit [Rhodopseudomonas]|uniref:TRAP transporter n=1 Tax=Rhodopseudomonas palustris TaxID=1076 RepID=A0A0D7EM04_RHOPL|nr:MULTISPECIES: TAXI family TRAP transporter solute-binding subunit [Rhodopseudomonas]KIZ41590.1 TRAP transporter [Rhodopseudomonas palustris]MDF3810362.1 TAXI family TRAP transporter solute-binding subunit [Rhodopseudomonas sp. BAL398]WOK19989.1 TAXI family TRAP transporter solute-binding subunit [Rhodopseudomonas sp. BAL398]